MANSKFYRVEKGEERFTTCPICCNKNDHLTGQCCNHLFKVTSKGVAFYWWGHRPDGFSEVSSRQVDEIRCAQFDRAFPKSREHWRTMYLALREGGDSHSTAVETIRAEMQMASL